MIWEDIDRSGGDEPAPPGKTCREQHEDGYICTRPTGHKGDHIAMGLRHAIRTWGRR